MADHLIAAEEHFMCNKDAAAFIGISERTLDRRRTDGTGPKFARIGRRVIYTRSDLLAWVRAHSQG